MGYVYICKYVYIYTCIYIHMYMCVYIYIYIYPPTPTFAKPGAAPGTTGGVKPVFVGLQRLKIFLARPTPQATGTPRPDQ